LGQFPSLDVDDGRSPTVTGEGVITTTQPKDISRRIAAEVSWSLTSDRSERTRPGRQAFLARFEREVDPEGKLSSDERRIRAQHALRAHMMRLAKRSAAARTLRR
jgi:hypothetical protein